MICRHQTPTVSSAHPIVDTVGEFARSLISGAALQVGGTWNQWFTVVHRNSPTVSPVAGRFRPGTPPGAADSVADDKPPRHLPCGRQTQPTALVGCTTSS